MRARRPPSANAAASRRQQAVVEAARRRRRSGSGTSSSRTTATPRHRPSRCRRAEVTHEPGDAARLRELPPPGRARCCRPCCVQHRGAFAVRRSRHRRAPPRAPSSRARPSGWSSCAAGPAVSTRTAVRTARARAMQRRASVRRRRDRRRSGRDGMVARRARPGSRAARPRPRERCRRRTGGHSAFAAPGGGELADRGGLARPVDAHRRRRPAAAPENGVRPGGRSSARRSSSRSASRASRGGRPARSRRSWRAGPRAPRPPRAARDPPRSAPPGIASSAASSSGRAGAAREILDRRLEHLPRAGEAAARAAPAAPTQISWLSLFRASSQWRAAMAGSARGAERDDEVVAVPKRRQHDRKRAAWRGNDAFLSPAAAHALSAARETVPSEMPLVGADQALALVELARAPPRPRPGRRAAAPSARRRRGRAANRGSSCRSKGASLRHRLGGVGGRAPAEARPVLAAPLLWAGCAPRRSGPRAAATAPARRLQRRVVRDLLDRRLELDGSALVGPPDGRERVGEPEVERRA